MSRRPAANSHQSQEDEGQQRSADDTYEVASSPQLARRCQSVSHDQDAHSPHERTGIVGAAYLRRRNETSTGSRSSWPDIRGIERTHRLAPLR
jgi:hypothetical protein